MIRKFALILLLTIYALSSFGIGIKQFYCCGKLKSTDISFVEQDKKKCGNGNESDGCCKTKYQVFKVKDSHVAAEGLSIPTKFFAELHLLTSPIEIAALTIESKRIADPIHGPPPPNIPLYIFNCVYRI